MRFIRYILYMVSAALLLGCSSGRSDNFLVGISQCSDDAWRQQMNAELSQEALFFDDMTLEFRSADSDSDKQREDIDYFIDKGVDLLIVAPNEADPITPSVEKAFLKGIPVVVVDRKISSENYTAYVGADNYQIGRSIGLYVAKLLQRGGNVLELTGMMSSTPAVERHEGFIDGISSNPRVRLLASMDAQWQTDFAYDRMLEALGQFDDIDIVFAHNDFSAFGAYQAAKSVGEQNSISFIGIDALPGPGNGVELVLNGILSATFIYPSGGDKILQLAHKILVGENFQRNTTLNTSIVDRSNAPLMDLQSRHISEQQGRISLLNGRLESLSASFVRQRFLLWLAIIVVCLIVILAGILLWLLHQRNQLNDELKDKNLALEQQRDRVMDISRELEDATQAKLNFFTNVSHEFKTPLTLIIDPLNQLLQSGDLSDDQRYLLQTACDNSASLKDLVTQILDFRKYDRGEQKLDLSRMDLAVSIKGWNDAFLPAFASKHVRFDLLVPADADLVIEGDSRKIERIYFNILSNALKFTPENGSVKVSLSRDDSSRISVSVQNSGSYISPEEQKMIFRRFYTSDTLNAGTGIGLALADAYAKMHGGEILVESSRKTGTTFTLVLPVGHPELLPQAQSPATIEEKAPLQHSSIDVEDEVMSHDHSQSILVVDDNESIRTYLGRLLKDNYYVIEAKDGNEGLRKALQYIPNIIISDVMMPGLSGFELCRRLKAEMTTCHIPVILLTAYSMDENHVDAYEAGADSYISKPFSSDVLMARIQNLLDSRVRIKTGSDDILTLGNEKVEDMDREFMSRFKTVIDENMVNSELSVDYISDQLGMSRVQLYRKVKMLTNLSPNEYLRIRRLKKAQHLLQVGDLTIAEVCYETGFISPSYFSKCYRDYYNELPSDYVRKIRPSETQN